MMASKGKAIKVNTRPTKAVIVDSLTRDVSIETCIFDLVDNSVDAARDIILQGMSGRGPNELVDSYHGYEVRISFSSRGFKVTDNCGGIDIAKLMSSVLRFGERSSHELGIGVFGVGLNRALFKLGKVSHLKTDTGKQRAELLLDSVEYLASDQWDLPAHTSESTGSVGTEIEIRQPSPEIVKKFEDADWAESITAEIGWRYGRLIEKNLSIFVNNVKCKNLLPQVRDKSLFDPLEKWVKGEGGVTIMINCGQHAAHRFSKEDPNSRVINQALSHEFGWNIICNDRAVIWGNQDSRTFWKKFHSEYNGFVGYVNFVGDPASLPWATNKTDIEPYNGSYQAARTAMQDFAGKWRSFVEVLKKDKGPVQPLPTAPPVQPDADADPAPSGVDPEAKPGSRPSQQSKDNKKVRSSPKQEQASDVRKSPASPKQSHNELTSLLPKDVNEIHCFDKHLALVREAKSINLLTHPYTGMALLRILFECTTLKFMTRHGEMEALRDFAENKRNGKVPLTEEEKKKIVPALDEMLAFMQNKGSALKSENTAHLVQCLQKMSSHQKILNGVVHNAYQTIHRSEALQIRDSVLPILRHLIEN